MSLHQNDKLENIVQYILYIIVFGFFVFLIVDPTLMFTELRTSENVASLSDIKWNFQGLPVRLYIVLFIVSVISTKYFSSLIRRYKGLAPNPKYVPSIILLAIVLTLTASSVNEIKTIKRIHKLFYGKTLPEKYTYLYGKIYHFAMLCKPLAYPHNSSGHLISPFDPEQTLEPYLVQYFLYPDINLVGYKDNKVKNLVIFRMENQDRFINPSDTVYKFSNFDSLVIKNDSHL